MYNSGCRNEADAVKYLMMGVGALVQGLVVYALNFAYALIAEKLTEWEVNIVPLGGLEVAGGWPGVSI